MAPVETIGLTLGNKVGINGTFEMHIGEHLARGVTQGTCRSAVRNPKYTPHSNNLVFRLRAPKPRISGNGKIIFTFKASKPALGSTERRIQWV
jgi:hypothetical protein